MGAIFSPLLTGIYPIWLIATARRQHNFASRLKFLSSPFILATLFVLLVIAVLAHRLFIWELPLGRISAFADVTLIIGLSGWL